MTTIPTKKQLFDGILANFEAEYSISVNPFGHAFLVALAGVLAGFLWLYYLAVGDTQKNIWFDKADSVDNGGTLERFGVTILKRWPFAATKGQYTIAITGSVGGIIPGTTVYKADDSSESPGALFQIVGGDHTMAATSETITIIALNGGRAYRLAASDSLTSTSPLVNVDLGAVVVTETIVPEDAEDKELYRQKITEKVQLRPGSWSATDYRLLGTSVTGVGQTYAYATSGAPNEVNVWIQGTTPVAFPGPSASGTVITAYETALALVQPITVWAAHVNSCPIKNIDITIAMGTFPAFPAAQIALVQTALQQLVNGVHPFIAAAGDAVAERNDVVATFNLISTVTAAVPGFGFSGVTFTVAGTPMTEWQADNGEIPYMNTITYA